MFAALYAVAAGLGVAALSLAGAESPESYAAASSLAYIVLSLWVKPPIPSRTATAISLASAAILIASLAVRVLS